MDPISALALTKTVQGVSDTVQSLTKDVAPGTAPGFESVMRGMLAPDEANSINEEELFAALIAERLGVHAGPEAGSAYQKLLEEKKSANTRADGYVNVEQSANEALSALVADGTLTEDVADKVRKESFAAAQLDDNKTALYDGRGGSNDPTIAVMNMEAALIQAQQMITKLESGDVELPEDTGTSGETKSDATGGSSSVTPEGNAVDGENSGFIFKPESEHHKKLVVILPAQMAHDVQEILLKDENGETVERGVSSGYANPDSHGEREHFRFTKAGGEYPANLTVEVVMADGSTKQYSIPDPSQRYD